MMDERLEAAVRLREAGDAEGARVALMELAATRSDDAVVQYQTAWVHDVLGLESGAIPFYERALELGLEGEDRLGALVGLGSSYRNLGRHDDAERTLRAGREEFGHGGAFDAFLAMVLHDLGRHAEAMELLLTALTSTTADASIQRYRRAIEFYAGRLDET